MPAQDRLYRFFLFLLPADFRKEAGDDLVQLFSDQRRDASRRPLRLPGLWLAAFWDLSVHGLAMRWARRPRPVRRVLLGRRHMRAVWGDIRQGFRLVRRNPTTSLLAIVTLALGIGANTAIFSLVDPVLIRSLPYAEPDQLVWEKRAR